MTKQLVASGGFIGLVILAFYIVSIYKSHLEIKKLNYELKQYEV